MQILRIDYLLSFLSREVIFAPEVSAIRFMLETAEITKTIQCAHDDYLTVH